MFILPDDAQERKKWPLATFLRGYFPDAIAYLAHLSWVGNQQHNPGEPMHWAREKSTDHEEAMMRHFFQGEDVDTDEILHAGKRAWRDLAMLQLLLEKRHEKPPIGPSPTHPLSRLFGSRKAEWQPGYPQVVNFKPAGGESHPAKPAEETAGADEHSDD